MPSEQGAYCDNDDHVATPLHLLERKVFSASSDSTVEEFAIQSDIPSNVITPQNYHLPKLPIVY